MKKYGIFIMLVLLIQFALGSTASTKTTFRITRVYDGDTVMAVRNSVVIYVMLVGIDAPEISEAANMPDQPYGRKAKEYLASLILDKDVEIKGYGKAPYPDNNIIGVIFLNGRNINLEMVRQGLAEVFQKDLPPGFDITPYLEAEKQARINRAGMWSLGNKYVSPSRWRQMHKVGMTKRP
ncbi:MAG: thermonuclease family protein [Deltaproteobacteria bacterium]|nr:thermonuclease family protein [Deltaproteobacteria bacterium]MBW2025181.1 thermonuclease family protein [Deltaproteobacteria bacterium]